jgi:hypothetical protein
MTAGVARRPFWFGTTCWHRWWSGSQGLSRAVGPLSHRLGFPSRVEACPG